MATLSNNEMAYNARLMVKLPERQPDPDNQDDDIVVMTTVDHPGIIPFMYVIRKPKLRLNAAEAAGAELFNDIRSQREEIYRSIAAGEVGGIDLSDPDEVAKLRLDERAEDESHDE